MHWTVSINKWLPSLKNKRKKKRKKHVKKSKKLTFPFIQTRLIYIMAGSKRIEKELENVIEEIPTCKRTGTKKKNAKKKNNKKQTVNKWKKKIKRKIKIKYFLMAGEKKKKEKRKSAGANG